MNTQCRWLHNWGKWQLGTNNMERYIEGKMVPFSRDVQYRHCIRCGLLQQKSFVPE